MPYMQQSDKAIAIFTADWHLLHTPPVWRSNEPDWYAAMKRPLEEIYQLSLEHHCPVFCAGDIFNHWYGAIKKGECTELLNWAMANVPESFSIAGQHDLPNHNVAEMHKSAYHNLVLSETITNLGSGISTFSKQKIIVHSYPYGSKLEPITPTKDFLTIALIHEYACITGSDYPNAPQKAYVHKKVKNTKYGGYDIIVYGDNHKGFSTTSGTTKIFNCGTLMRCKSDEEAYRPRVGLLYADGSIETHYLDISKDVHLTAEEEVKVMAEREEELDVEALYTELKKLGDSALEYATAVKQHCHKHNTEKAVVDELSGAMES